MVYWGRAGAGGQSVGDLWFKMSISVSVGVCKGPQTQSADLKVPYSRFRDQSSKSERLQLLRLKSTSGGQDAGRLGGKGQKAEIDISDRRRSGRACPSPYQMEET